MRLSVHRSVVHKPLRMQTVARQTVMAAQVEAKQLLRKTVKQALRQMDKAEQQLQSGEDARSAPS